MFMYQHEYLAVEQAKGAVATHVVGDVVSVSRGKPGTRYFSAEELTYPGLENGNIFVTTRHLTIKQKRDVCEDTTMPCLSDSDCTIAVGGKCTENGWCEEPAWCNVEPVPEIYKIDSKDLTIWVKSSIQFVQLDAERIFSTEADELGGANPKLGFNTFTAEQIMMMTKPMPVRFEEVSELGAALEVQFVWNCRTDDKMCKPEMRVKRLDTIFDPEHIGYFFNYAEYISEDVRVLNQLRGIRFWFRTTGVGKRLDVPTIVMKASTGMALMALAPIVADQLMIKLFANKTRFRARKYAESPDFGDYMNKLDALREAEEALPELHSKADEDIAEEEKSFKKLMMDEPD